MFLTFNGALITPSLDASSSVSCEPNGDVDTRPWEGGLPRHIPLPHYFRNCDPNTIIQRSRCLADWHIFEPISVLLHDLGGIWVLLQRPLQGEKASSLSPPPFITFFSPAVQLSRECTGVARGVTTPDEDPCFVLTQHGVQPGLRITGRTTDT